MAWAFVQGKIQTLPSSSATAAATYDASVTAGSLLVCFCSNDSSATIDSCADDVNGAWTAIAATQAGINRSVRGFYLKNATGGSAPTVTVTYSGSAAARSLTILEYSGLDTSAPLDASSSNAQTNPGTGTDAITSTALTAAGANELMLGFTLANAGAETIATGTGFTQRGTASVSGGAVHVEDQNAAGGSATATWTASSATADYVSWAVAFKQPSTGTTISVGSGAVRVTGQAPNLSQASPQVAAGLGTLTWQGLAPNTNETLIAPMGLGSLSFAGQYLGVAFLVPSAGALRFTGKAPSLSSSYAAPMGVGVVAFTGQTVSLTPVTVLSPTTGRVVFTGAAPSFPAHYANLGAGAIVFGGTRPAPHDSGISVSRGKRGRGRNRARGEA